MELPYILFIALGFFASFISAVFGFGTALVVVALGSYILPVKESIALAAVLFIALTTSKTYLFRHYIDWKIVFTLSIASFPFAYLGGLLLEQAPAELLKRCLGGMILIYLLLTQFKWLPKFKVGTVGLITGSALYGFISGLLGSGNLVKAIMFREMNITKEAFVGAMAASSVLANLSKLTAYYQSGLLHQGLAVTSAWLLISAIVATLIGRRLLTSIDSNQFEQAIKLILALSAIGLLI